MKYVWLILTVGWFVFMTYLSHQNETETAETSFKLAEFLGNEDLTVVHVVVFFVFLVRLSLSLKGFGADGRFVLVVLILAAVDEATKLLVDGRHFAWFDVGLNEIGSLIGIVIGLLL